MTVDRFALVVWGLLIGAVAAIFTAGVRSPGWSVPILLIVFGLVGLLLGMSQAKRWSWSRPWRVPIGLAVAALAVLLPLCLFVSVDTAHPERTIWGRGWYQNFLAPPSKYIVTAKRLHPDIEDAGCLSYSISDGEETETCFRLQEDLVGFEEGAPAGATDYLSCHGWSRGVILASVIRRRSTFDIINIGDPLPDCWRRGIDGR